MTEENLQGKEKYFSKEIAGDNYYYLRSCIRQNFFPGSETTFVRIIRDLLGKNIYDDAAHTTCTGIGYHSDIVPFDTLQTVAARQFALMTERGFENLAVSCVTSYGIYCEILETWKEFPGELEKARLNLKKATGREFEIPKNVAHTSDIIYKYRREIGKASKYNLVHCITGEPLNIVEHIGCHYAKIFPERSVGGGEFSKVLSGMIESWGGNVVDYPERRHCCGFGFRQYIIRANRGYSLSNTKKKFESMEPYHPDAVICNCPGCTMFMDRWQYALKEMENKSYGGEDQGIPVLTYEELAGLVLGYDPWDLGLQMHQTDSEPLLDKLGIRYDASLKYCGKNGKRLPSAPETECPGPIRIEK